MLRNWRAYEEVGMCTFLAEVRMKCEAQVELMRREDFMNVIRSLGNKSSEDQKVSMILAMSSEGSWGTQGIGHDLVWIAGLGGWK
jgi:hypothetical protein